MVREGSCAAVDHNTNLTPSGIKFYALEGIRPNTYTTAAGPWRRSQMNPGPEPGSNRVDFHTVLWSSGLQITTMSPQPPTFSQSEGSYRSELTACVFLANASAISESRMNFAELP
ncbi:hypothetical protein CHU98_g7188 [Xylaria longipes]|nr:hypothetical protein CHU98_g7188 [Xylaria longipes]